MQGVKEGSDVQSQSLVPHAGLECGPAVEPWHDGPPVLVQRSGYPGAHARRDRQWQTLHESGEDPLLLKDERSGFGPLGNAAARSSPRRSTTLSQSSAAIERKAREAGVLVSEQALNQRHVHVDISSRHELDASSTASRGGFPIYLIAEDPSCHEQEFARLRWVRGV